MLAAILAACDPDAPAADDKPVTDRALTALDTDVVQLRVFERMLRPIGVKNLPPELVVDAVIAQIKDRLGPDLLDPGCLERTALADGLSLRFNACDYADTSLDGSLRVTIAAETGDCSGAPCVTAIVYTLELDELALGAVQIASASKTLRIPTDLSERSYHGEAELITPKGPLSTRTDASWTSAAGCFTADFGLEIATDTQEISAAGSAVHVCEANCPDSGEGLIAWGSGSTLAWRYTGKGQLQVRGPKGRVFTVTQACANK
jgi:hypothetical protein